jgi:hypothetical protein
LLYQGLAAITAGGKDDIAGGRYGHEILSDQQHTSE